MKRKKTLADEIVARLDAGKAEDIRVLDVRERSSFADQMIIATGTSTRHVSALAHNLIRELKKEHVVPFNDPKQSDGHWVVADFGNVIVHLFTAETRGLYDLETLWAPKSEHSRTGRRKSA